MEYLNVENQDFTEVMRELRGITNSGKIANKILDYIKDHKEILDDDEYYKEERLPLLNSNRQRGPDPNSGPINFMIMHSKYSINIKKITVIILLILLNAKVPEGLLKILSSMTIAGTSFTIKPWLKITDEQRCLALDITLYKRKEKRTSSDFNYLDKECVQNDIECPYRKEHTCKRTIKDIELQLHELENKKVIVRKNEVYKQTF